MAQLEHVTITPNPVSAGDNCIIRVAIATWGYFEKNHTWNNLKEHKWNEVESQWQKEM